MSYSDYDAYCDWLKDQADAKAERADDHTPALSDADVLERAAEIERRRGLPSLADCLAHDAAELRAASAPKPVDVFEAFDREWHAWDRGGEPLPLCGLAREWFGPLVDVVKSAAIWEDDLEDLRRLAACALEALRQRAQEASR